MNEVFGGAFILLGLFLLFALAFNGGVGISSVNYTFFISSLLLVIIGFLRFSMVGWRLIIVLTIASAVLYTPMVWQRFNFNSVVVMSNVYFDLSIITTLLVSLTCKPNKAQH
jgi:hypothetical protein